MSKNVFISYPDKDRKLAEKLMRALQAEGISTTWVDKEVIEPGTNWQQRLEAAIGVADAIIVLVDSKHKPDHSQRFEWTMALEAEWKNPDKKLIPLLLRNAELPSFLASKQAIRVNDLSKEWDQAVEELIRILKDEQTESETSVSIKLADYSEWLDRLKYIEAQAETLKQYELSHDHRFQLRLNKKIDDLQRQWELLNEKLSGLNEQWILETRFEEKLRLIKSIEDTKTQLDQVEEQLKDMENHLAKVDSDAKEVAGQKR